MTASYSYGSLTKSRGGRVNKALFFGGSGVSLEFDSSISMAVCSLFKSLKLVDCLFVFTFLSQTLYFNPLFLIFRYHFYYLTTTNEIKIFVITRRILKAPKETEFEKLKRINDFTFIDLT